MQRNNEKIHGQRIFRKLVEENLLPMSSSVLSIFSQHEFATWATRQYIQLIISTKVSNIHILMSLVYNKSMSYTDNFDYKIFGRNIKSTSPLQQNITTVVENLYHHSPS